MSNIKKSPHDELFKKIFKNRENARDLLNAVLPQNILASMDMESVYVEDVSYLDENLTKHFSDLVLRNGDELTSPSRRTDLGQVCSISKYKSCRNSELF